MVNGAVVYVLMLYITLSLICVGVPCTCSLKSVIAGNQAENEYKFYEKW